MKKTFSLAAVALGAVMALSQTALAGETLDRVMQNKVMVETTDQAAYLANSAVRQHWPTMPFALGSYACYRPGQAAFSGSEGVAEGRLHFCGEHTSVDFQGYMEGGAESGARAAREILVDLGLAQPEPEEPEAADGEPEAEEAAEIRRAVHSAIG